MSKKYHSLREKVLRILNEGQKPTNLPGPITYRIGKHTVKARVTNARKKTHHNFWFSINRSILKVDYTCYICGNEKVYYVLPQDVIRSIYYSPHGKMDSKHPSIKPFTIDTQTDELFFQGDKRQNPWDLRPFKCVKTLPVIDITAPVDTGKYPNGIEGDDHFELKLYIADHPSEIGILDAIPQKTEIDSHIFPSKDRPDIIFHCKDNKHICIEIETDNPYPGAYQAVKYKALLEAELIEKEIKKFDVHSILVAWSIGDETRHFCDLNDIKYYEKNMIDKTNLSKRI